MTTWLRRLFWLAVIAGAAFALWTGLKRRTEQPAGPATTPPRRPPAPEPAFIDLSHEVVADVEPEPEQTWAAPVDGACPDGYPIKAAKSGIYHVPGGRSYERTVAARCYRNPDDAEADGYRRAKA